MADEPNPEPPDRRKLLAATGIAALAALLLLVTVVMPAEFGIDPTGVGSLLGINDLSSGGNAPDETAAGTGALNLSTYSASWPVSTVALPERDGSTAEGQETIVGFDVVDANVTAVRATLTWEDTNESATGDPTAPDLFELVIMAPDGTSSRTFLGRNQVGQPGNVTADLQWRPAPAPLRIQAPDPARAYFGFLDAVPPDFSGVGAWNVTVRMVEAGDAEAAGVPVGGASPDEGNDWSLAFEFDVFRLDAGDLASQASRTDTVNITIAPGRGLEYKFFLSQGAVLEFNWSAAAELYFDFHGERARDKSGAFTSHAEGTASGDAGRLEAPFSGTHGWYWENPGDQDVVVTLTTSGVYSVVGEV